MPTKTRTAKASGRDERGQRPAAGRQAAQAEQDTSSQDTSSGWSAEGLPARAWSDTQETLKRTWRQWIPHLAASVVLGAGLGAQAIVASGAVTPVAAATDIAIVAYPAALLAALKVGKRHPVWKRRLVFGALGTATWLTTAPFGVGAGQVELLAGLELALSARWWQTHRIPYPKLENGAGADIHDEAGEPVVPETLATPEQILADWTDYAASRGGPAQGSKLWLPEPTKHGFAFDLELDRGRQNLAELRNQLAKVASALDLNVADLIVEEHPLLKSPHRGRLQVITDSPIKGDVVFTGPRRIDDDGNVLLELGPYADGVGEARWRLYTPGSMWSGVIIGGTGIGKSRVVENIIISSTSGGDTEYWYIDPNRGGSSPALARHADWFATADNADDVLLAALDILDARGDENAYENWTGFTPSPARPGLIIVVEECHRIFTQDTAHLWARVAREGRKLGVSLLCISQYPGLETFGGKEALRSSVMEGNALVLRSTSNQTKQLMAGLELDPKSLPKIPGYAYTIGSEETGIRTAPFRNRNTDPARDGQQALAWLAAQPRPGLDQLTITATTASGDAYTNRHASNTTGRTASAQRVAQLRAGHLPKGSFAGNAKAKSTPQPVGDLGAPVGFPMWSPTFGQDTTTGDQTAAFTKLKTELDQLARDIAAANTAGAPDHQVQELYKRFTALQATTAQQSKTLSANLDDTDAALKLVNLQLAGLLGGAGMPTPPSLAPPSAGPAPASAGAAAAETTTVVRRVDLTDSQKVVLDAVAAGACTPSDLEAVVPLRRRQIQTILSQLVTLGLLTQPKYGSYKAVA